MSEKRQYQKRSDYWNKFAAPQNTLVKSADFTPELLGESFYESVAATTSSARQTSYRTNNAAKNPLADRYKNIRDGLLPYKYSADIVDVRDAIELCQKAYFNISSFRSTIDLLSEFADSDIYLEGGTEKSRKFIEAWFKTIKLHDLKSQFFREYYRSGNVFLYTLKSRIKNSAQSLMESYGAEKSEIPVKYVLLNPVDIGASGSVSFGDYEYVKMLTPFEIARIKKPQSDYEKQLRSSFDAALLRKIDASNRSTADAVYMKLDSTMLNVVFAKKQDYEPLSIPMVFAVLDDINKKIELKKIDQAIARSIENVVLLVTMGAEPDKGGVNDKNLKAMQEIFKNKSVGRVLVSDYTTKAEFIIPDLRKVIGKEKYEVLNKDIEEGLQNILIGESKYADTKLKLKIFMNRLDESRNLFLKEFLQQEIKKVCKSVGMRAWPTAKFTKTDTLDDSDLQKLVTRMMELGVLTPEQGIHTIKTGVFPKEEDMQKAQEDFKKLREEGYYLPLVNSINVFQGEQEKGGENPKVNGRPDKKPQNGAVKSGGGGRPMGTTNANFSKKNILAATKAISEFELKTFASFAEKFGTERAESQKEVLSNLCESIVVGCEADNWESTLSSVIEDFDKLSELNILPDILDIGAKHGLDDLSSAILHHSTKISVTN